MPFDVTFEPIDELTASEELRVQEIDALADSAADEAMGKSSGSVVNKSVVAGGNTWYEETPTGVINGSNVTYTLSNTPNSNSLSLYINRQLLISGGVDYSITGSTITMTNAIPSSFSSLPFIARYQA